jgi:carbon storage regulator CsrA
MLVLTRKRSETIRIGDGIVVKVIRTGRTSVKLGVEAPSNVRVVRGELLPLAEPTQQTPEPPPHPPRQADHPELVASYSEHFTQPRIV